MSPLKDWNALAQSERVDLLAVASQSSGRTENILEKDLWVVAVLESLFTSSFAERITFSGGTSLSKCHNLIDRFSEDIDLVWDVTDLIKGGIEGKSRNAIKESREYQIQPALMERLGNLVVRQIQKTLPEVQIEIESTPRAVAAVVKFPSIVSLGSGPLSSVKVELFGMGINQPNSRLHVQTYLGDYEKQLILPSIDVSALDPKVIFWQKLTIIQRANLEPLTDWKLARHWTDVRDLHNSLGFELLVDEFMITSIIKRAAMLQNRAGVDYHHINTGGLLLIPKDPEKRQSLALGLRQTISNGYYPNDLDVEQLIRDCESIEHLINEHFSKLQ